MARVTRRGTKTWITLGVLVLAVACVIPFRKTILLSLFYEMHDIGHPDGIHLAVKSVEYVPGSSYFLYRCPDCPGAGTRQPFEFDDARGAGVVRGKVAGVSSDVIVLTVGEDDSVESGSLFLLWRDLDIVGVCRVTRTTADLSGAEIIHLEDSMVAQMGDHATKIPAGEIETSAGE